jgi:hypothetical protein
MKTTTFKLGTLAMALAGCALVTTPAVAEESTGDQWTFAVTPYLWLPNINGSLKYDLPNFDTNPEVETGPNDYLSNLDMAFMINGEARKGKWSIFTDFIYLDFGSEDSHVKSFGGTDINATIDLGTKSSLSGDLWTLVGGYAVVQDPGATLDVIGGFRYLGIEAKTNWSLSATINDPNSGETLAASGSISQDANLLDGIVGVRGHVRLGKSNWSIPYYADVGAGDSDLTWQAMAGLAYNWSWGDVVVAYRYLSYDMADDKLLQDVSFGGPALGVTFRW